MELKNLENFYFYFYLILFYLIKLNYINTYFFILKEIRIVQYNILFWEHKTTNLQSLVDNTCRSINICEYVY